MPNGRQGQSPGPRHVLEGQITAIAEHGHRRLQTREAAQVFHGIARGVTTVGSAHRPEEVGIQHVMVIARAHDEVLEPIQIHVHKDRAPRPIGGTNSRHLRDLRIGAIATAQEEGVARHLRSERRIMRRPVESGEVISALTLAGRRIGREHVHHHEVVDTIPVDVGEIHPHGGHGNLPDGLGHDGLKTLAAGVAPEGIPRKQEVIANINFRLQIPVEITESHTETPIMRGLREGLASGIHKRSRRPRNRAEDAPSLVAIEDIHFPTLVDHDAAPTDPRGSKPRRRNRDGFSVHDPQGRLGPIESIPISRRAVIGYINFRETVPGDVGRGHGSRSQTPSKTAVGRLRESAQRVVEKQARAAAQSIHQQVQIAVSIHIHQKASGGSLTRAIHSGCFRCFLEAPSSAVEVQRIRTLQAAQVEVRQAVAIDVAQRHARAIFEDAVPGR